MFFFSLFVFSLSLFFIIEEKKISKIKWELNYLRTLKFEFELDFFFYSLSQKFLFSFYLKKEKKIDTFFSILNIIIAERIKNKKWRWIVWGSWLYGLDCKQETIWVCDIYSHAQINLTIQLSSLHDWRFTESTQNVWVGNKKKSSSSLLLKKNFILSKKT